MINVLSFLIVAFGQPAWVPFLAPIAACLGYALFWHGCRHIESAKKRFWMAVGWYACVQAVQLSWMTAVEFQGFYILGVYVGLLFLLGLQFGALTYGIFRLPKLTVLSSCALASLWVLFEWSRLFFLSGFSWNPAGMALTAFSYSLQFASLLGVFGLSFLVIFSNLVVLLFLRQSIRLAWVVAISLVPYVFGAVQLGRLGDDKGKQMSIALVQTNWLPSEKIPLYNYPLAFVSAFDQWDTMLAALKKGIGDGKVDLIVFPEAAVPRLAHQQCYPYHAVKALLQTRLGEEVLAYFPPSDRKMVSNLFLAQVIANFYQAEVVLGLDDRDDSAKENYQAAFHLYPQEIAPQRYEKRILLPLAEYIPFQWLQHLTKRYGIQEFYTPGSEVVLSKGDVPISLSICYEETFSNFMREGRMKGAELYVNITNDNWYPHSKLAKQHFDHARVRSVENGVPLVRSCNAGLSGAIDSLGRVVNKKNIQMKNFEKSEVILVTVSLFCYQTLYTILGDFGIVVLSVFFVMVFCLKMIIRPCSK
jgi:apolipoprotein N-acyltransferase